MRINLPKFTLVGATTRLALLTGPLRDRFGAVLRLDFYEQPAMEEIIRRSAVILDVPLDPEDAIAPITPYVVMRVGRVPVLPYTMPGSADIAPLVRARAADHAAILLANHGPVVAGTSLESAVFAAEELEETARLLILTRGLNVRHLDPTQIATLNTRFKLK